MKRNIQRINLKGRQRGVMLLEALIAILIFSIGILAVIGMQAVSIANVGEAKYRTDGSFLANEIIGKMWANRANIADYRFPGGGNLEMLAWVNKVSAALPGAAANPPVINVVSTNWANGSGSSSHTIFNVTVTVQWQSPADASAGRVPHNFTTTAQMQWCAPPAYAC